MRDWEVLVTFSQLCYNKISYHFPIVINKFGECFSCCLYHINLQNKWGNLKFIGCFQANGRAAYMLALSSLCSKYISDDTIYREIVSPLSPLLSVVELKTSRIPMTQIISHLPQLCLGEFKIGWDRLQMEEENNKGRKKITLQTVASEQHLYPLSNTLTRSGSGSLCSIMA